MATLPAGEIPSAGSAKNGIEADAIAHGLAALGMLQGWKVKQLAGQQLVKEGRVHFGKDKWLFCRPPIHRLQEVWQPVTYVQQQCGSDGSARGIVDGAFKQLRDDTMAVDEEAGPLFFSCK